MNKIIYKLKKYVIIVSRIDKKRGIIIPLVTTKEILLDAQKNKYAIGAFNVENMEMVMAVVAAAEELKSPVIMQTTPSTVKYASLEYF